ncbi:MAG TPA: serine/threonine-protein kinase [Myxococcales bacterium]|jgi:serine/threonine protein kinase
MASGPTRYGKYLLLEKLNGGGMSEVWRAASSGATHANLAIKRMLPNMAMDTEIVAMFINEARIAAQLAHPNIAQVFDLGRIGDDFFIAMEYVGGADLRLVLGRSAEVGVPMPIPLVAFVAAQICDALDYAHHKTGVSGEPLGLVHRDISPENCLVTFDGTVKLIDFGIAKVTRQASQTKAGVLKGKLGYMSPEQVTGQVVDRRSDLFSLATVVYEMVTGRQLFKAENEYLTVHALCRGRIAAPSEANPHVPAALDRVVLKALSRDRVQRYQWASEMAADLRAFLSGLRPEPSPAQLRKFMSVAFAPELAVERARRTAWARAHSARELKDGDLLEGEDDVAATDTFEPVTQELTPLSLPVLDRRGRSDILPAMELPENLLLPPEELPPPLPSPLPGEAETIFDFSLFSDGPDGRLPKTAPARPSAREREEPTGKLKPLDPTSSS